MTTKTKVILGGIGLFLLLGVIGNATSPKTSVEGIQTVAPTVEITATDTPTIEQVQGDPEVQYDQGEQAEQDAIDSGQYTPQTQDNVSITDDSQSGLSNNSYYTNSDGNQVHSPAYSNNGSVPAGTTAQCNDGTYSFSQHHSGTCSGHGGVVQWYQ